MWAVKSRHIRALKYLTRVFFYGKVSSIEGIINGGRIVVSNYFDLHWLAKSEKDTLPPRLIYSTLEDASGYCYPPKNEEIIIGNSYFSQKRGIIVVGISDDDKLMVSTIAHEWRHFYQFQKNGFWETEDKDWDWGKENYKKEIIRFFISQPDEYDALLFELKTYPCETSLEWYEWIINR